MLVGDTTIGIRYLINKVIRRVVIFSYRPFTITGARESFSVFYEIFLDAPVTPCVDAPGTGCRTAGGGIISVDSGLFFV